MIPSPPTPLVWVIACAAAYLCGSIPFGVLVARARGVDIQKVGSGNIGATNVARNLGKKSGALVLVLDAGKGFGPVFAARHLWPATPELVAAVGLAAIVGHMFPVWLKLRGGKGVATGLGVFLALAPLAAAAAVVLFAGVYAAFRIASIGSLVATTGLFVTLALLRPPRAHLVLGAAVWALIVLKHSGNIKRLFRREEGKI